MLGRGGSVTFCLDHAAVSSTLHGSNDGGNERGGCLPVLVGGRAREGGQGTEGQKQHIPVGVLACVEEVGQPREEASGRLGVDPVMTTAPLLKVPSITALDLHGWLRLLPQPPKKIDRLLNG